MKGYKWLIFRVLCNGVVGWMIGVIFSNKIPDIRWRLFRFHVSPKQVNRKMVASIFWGFYESAEIRFVEKYVDGTRDVLELGGSIGVVSSHIASKLQHGKKLISVDANPMLVELIESNVKNHLKRGANAWVENCAISYFTDTVELVITDNNTETQVVKEPARNGSRIVVRACTMESIVNANHLTEFAVVCDIEGSEIEILLNEGEILQRCSQLIIELHDTCYQQINYSVQDLVELIQGRHGFDLIEHHGPVYYFIRPSRG
jgi:FkbM family methyltransferase